MFCDVVEIAQQIIWFLVNPLSTSDCLGREKKGFFFVSSKCWLADDRIEKTRGRKSRGIEMDHNVGV